MIGEQLKTHILNGGFDSAFESLYLSRPKAEQARRYVKALDEFEKIFGTNRETRIFSAPGRSEIGGNHTDHQHGRVLAAAVNLDILCVASPNGGDVIRICSEGYAVSEVELSGLAPREDEKNTSRSLVRGIAAACRERGFDVRGFDAYLTSRVLKGSGLSSSAAFEVAVGAMINGLFCGGAISAVEIAQMGQYAENVFFGKPSGLMDQMASSVGGFVAIDFNDPKNPVIEKLDFDFAKSGYTLCIVDTKGSHADLTPEYAAIPTEMNAVAAIFGKSVLRDVNEDEFFSRLARVREKCGDRAALRAIHFFGDNRRVEAQARALKSGDFPAFLEMVIASGRSSAMYLQNLYACASPAEQGLSVACALSEKLLAGRGGAWRVQGGGFAGTIEAFVPRELLEEYVRAVEGVFGEGSCHLLSIRQPGGVEVTLGGTNNG